MHFLLWCRVKFKIYSLPYEYLGFPDSSVGKESTCNVGKISWRRDRLPTPVFLDFPCGSAGKESACNTGDLGSIPELGRSPGEWNGYPLQSSGLENLLDRGGGLQSMGVVKSWTQLKQLRMLVCLFLGEGNGNPLQDSCLENSMGRETWQATVHGVTRNQTWLSTSVHAYF